MALAQSQGISLTTEDVDLVNEAIKQEWLESIDTETPAGAFVHKMMMDNNDLQEANQQLQQISGQRGPTQKGELSEEDLEQDRGTFLLSFVEQDRGTFLLSFVDCAI